jgi:hypothetical protein
VDLDQGAAQALTARDRESESRPVSVRIMMIDVAPSVRSTVTLRKTALMMTVGVPLPSLKTII